MIEKTADSLLLSKHSIQFSAFFLLLSDMAVKMIVKVIFMHLLGKLETCCIPIKESSGPFLGLLDLIDGKFNLFCKVQLFWEGHTHLKKNPQLYLTFDDFTNLETTYECTIFFMQVNAFNYSDVLWI